MISAVLTTLSFGVLWRVPLSSREALEYIGAGHLNDGRPALFYRGHFIAGLWLLPWLGIATIHLMVRTLIALIGRLFAFFSNMGLEPSRPASR
jgi:hypothetical protein